MLVTMDARTTKKPASVAEDSHVLAEGTAKRDRLLASINLIGGIGLILALPFALRSGA
jgi:hypothetical protein